MRTVVIVEDQADARRMMQLLLESMGVRVFAADNGREGAALIEKVQPDLALVDLGLAGHERLRARASWSGNELGVRAR